MVGRWLDGWKMVGCFGIYWNEEGIGREHDPTNKEWYGVWKILGRCSVNDLNGRDIIEMRFRICFGRYLKQSWKYFTGAYTQWIFDKMDRIT